ncbi:TIP41-like protein [Ostrea edulis]|uniref:TIP41-like protein n=1 Tax=Ostrea edulis TaxID=37623 RepID=UPI0020955B12|nr:TIP41-like protein [Ostrea edulis]XP_056014235.1 TIP41-like protein [Ostrea edulis]
MSGGEDVAARARAVTERFQFGPWDIVSVKSHILKSEGPSRERFESQLELPQVPEMIFADNVLRMVHSDGYGIEFNALDALKGVDAHYDPLKVAVSQAWREARADCEHINDVVKPFDWTYTTDYKGTLIGKPGKGITVSETTERIDIEKLKVREKILFYEDMLLFEDELADNGTSVLNARMRVMPSGFFVLIRFFMRVDNVMIRVNDTRLHYEVGKKYMLREFTSKDDQVKDIKASPHVLTNPNEVANHLTLRKEVCEKLLFPETSSDDRS